MLLKIHNEECCAISCLGFGGDCGSVFRETDRSNDTHFGDGERERRLLAKLT